MKKKPLFHFSEITSKVFLLLFVIVFFLQSKSFSQGSSASLWNVIPESSIENADKREEKPVAYKTYSLDLQAMQSLLQNAPMEGTSNGRISQTVVEIPMPDGKLSRFRVVESPVMEPALGRMYPFIRTFSGQGIDDPTAVARFDYTLFGFHSMIMSANGWYFIEPFILGNTKDYIVYNKKDTRRTDNWICEVDSTFQISGIQNPQQSSVYRTNGASLRTYRLALACTGEYAATYGGTPAGAMSGMVTSVNRVSGVYELEVSIRLVLIANDNLLVYTNAATDPYTNGSGTTMLTENINNINAVIGSANYDIGHVFSTGGGGVAGLGVVCGTSKARGVTGRGSPIGDAFDIDYVAHEMGHQFGGNHTFNSVTGSCGGGNRAASAAYEPGSGTTIMAYAGICGADNIQPNSDAIFHTKSFDEIVIYSTTGTGNTCPVTTANGNTVPTITSAGANYTIPYSTPFKLTGSATDANGDALTYLWEEYDVTSTGSAPNSPTGNSPIFRVFVPTTDPTRVFPRMQDIVNNTQTLGELLPTYARTLNFRFTVRDNRLGGGGVNHPDTTVKVTVAVTTAPFAVTAPNTAVTWNTGTVQTVTWQVGGSNLSPVSCSNVNILLSTDGGYTYPITLLANTPNDGSQAITVPVVLTSQARVKVEAVGNIFFDISNTNFNITTSNPVVTAIFTSALPSSSICAGGQVNVDFTTDGPANSGNIFTAYLSDNTGDFTNGVSIGTLASTSAGTISAIIPAGTVLGGNYFIRVVSSNPVVTGSNNGANLIAIAPPAIPGAVSGTATVCQGQSGVVYSVPAIANATGYAWSLPAGASITAGSNTNSITVTFSALAVSGSVTVQGTNAGCSGSVSSPFAVVVNPIPVLSAITGSKTACAGQSSYVYSVTATAGTTGFNWTLPTGATISAGANTNTITVNYASNAVSGTLIVYGSNSCGNSTTVSSFINVVPLPQTPVISAGGPTTFCSGGSVQLSYVPTGNTVYNWRQDGVLIPAATTSTYNATASGNYDVIADSIKPFSIAPALAIPDFNACANATSSIVVSGYAGTVTSSGISVRINITHTYDADLSLVLIAPNGMILGLANQIGSSGDNFTNTVFSDAGTAQIPATGAPYTGTYKPYTAVFSNTCVTTTATSFASLGGGSINPNGTWSLIAYDLASVDVGTINDWTISFPASLNSPCPKVSATIPVTVNPAPVIVSLSPSSGSVGTPVLISGSGFSGATSVSFNGTNAAFVVDNSSQITATVPAGATSGTITVITPCGTAVSPVAFTVTTSPITLNLTVLIEGFYTGGGLMNGVLSPSVCDTVTVKLANAISPYAFAATQKSTVNTSGQGSFVFTGISSGSSYYIVVQHRNSLETWSASPVVFSGSSVNYDFSIALNQAFGSNQILVSPGLYAIRSGDVNQDGIIENADFTSIQNNSQLFTAGYFPGDITGDNLIESADYSLIENNSQLLLMVAHP